MCGIFGTFANSTDVDAGLDRLAHRGPDGRGIEHTGPAIHGHVRLAVRDLSAASAQPFRYGSGLLSFVGELWNYRELKGELQRRGRTFMTTGDTEVLAQALDEWGKEALPRLDGMFAFAWSKGNSHILARDRFGKVPLYVRRRKQSFTWASERKAFSDPASCLPLAPGSFLDLVSGTVQQWYSLPSGKPENSDVLGMLRRGIRKRLDADAPVCCLISGGLDSSLILALAREAHPHIVAYLARYDLTSPDLLAARRLCRDLHVDLVEVAISTPTLEDVEHAIRAIEITSKAQIEIALLCLPLARRIAADGFKVCLSGEAADELFGGYGNMCIQASRTDDSTWRRIRIQQLAKMARGNFMRCNKVFMAHGVEARLPFMERELVESVLAMGKAQCPPGKKLLKRAAAPVLPGWIIKRPKQTFQGASGIAAACSQLLARPTAYYNAESRRLFGCLATA